MADGGGGERFLLYVHLKPGPVHTDNGPSSLLFFFFSLYTHRGGKVDGLERRRLV